MSSYDDWKLRSPHDEFVSMYGYDPVARREAEEYEDYMAELEAMLDGTAPMVGLDDLDFLMPLGERI